MNKPRHCPRCKSDNVGYTKLDFSAKDNKVLTARGYCHNCKASFEELYSIDFRGTRLYEDNPYAGPAGAPVSNASKPAAKKTPHRHVYEFYKEESSGMSPDAGCVWEEWKCKRCGKIIRRNERILEDEEWWHR